MNTTEWTPRIATAHRYLDAQYSLMAAATGEASIEETLRRLDDVRRARVAFNSLPPSEFIKNGDFSPSEVTDAVEFLEITLKAQQNDSLVLRWLQSAEWPSEVAEFERSSGLDIDPNYDIFIVGGASSEILLSQLQDRQFARLIKSNDILRDDDRNQVDEVKFRTAMKALPDIDTVRPNRVHYISKDISEDIRGRQLKTIKERMLLYYVSQNTNVLFAPIWTPNVLKNLPKISAHGKKLLDLGCAGEGSTAVVIGAGPSLDTLLPRIAAIKEQVIIICAFKALKAVTAAGIDPDFVICLDPKQKIRHLEGVDLSRVGAFVIEAASNAELVSTISGCPLIPFVASPIPLELIRSFGNIDIPVVMTGGSAVHGAIQTAIVLGCQKIYLAGTDFGFPNNRLYADRAGTGDTFTVSADGLSYDRQPLDSHQRGGELFPTQANSGKIIGASAEMIQFREWVQERIKKCNKDNEGIYFFNLCEEGAVIDGAPYVETIESPEESRERKQRVRAKIQALASVSTLKKELFRRRFSIRAERVKEMVDICDSILEKNSKNQDWTRDMQIMIKQAKKCLEISTMINDSLVRLQDYTQRVKSVGRVEADNLLVKLVSDTKVASKRISDVYDDILSSWAATRRSPTN